MSHSSLHVPMFGFVVLGFLLICVILAVAVWALFRSGADGKSRLGGVAGCAIALALVFIAGLAALACATVAFLSAGSEAVRRGPVKSITVYSDVPEGAPKEVARDPDRSVHLRIELRGTDDPSEITRWIREHTEGDLEVSIETRPTDAGPVTIVDVGLPISREDVLEMKKDLEEAAPDMHVPKGMKIEVKGPND